MGMSFKNHGGMLAEINVTPFVDVMLVLLIIFMVTAPLMTQGLDVDLPQARAVDVIPTDQNSFVLTIKKDGSIFLDEYQTLIPELQEQLTRLVKEQNKQLYLQADRDVPYGLVVEVMGEIKAAGIEKLGVLAETTDQPAKKPGANTKKR